MDEETHLNQNLQCNYLKCPFKSQQIEEMIKHIRTNHSNDFNFQIDCCFSNCSKKFKQMKSYENHVKSKHKKNEDPELCSIKCGVINCGKNILNVNDLYLHYFNHLRNRNDSQSIYCFYKNCDYECITARNFSNHLTRMHKKDIKELKDELLINIYPHEQDFEFETDLNDDCIEDHLQDENLDYKMTNNYLNFEKFYMMLYLKLKDKYLIAKYKCDEIFEDIDSIVKINNNNIIDLINHSKKIYSNGTNLIEIVETHLNKNKTLFEQVHNKNRFDSAKKKFLEKSGFYVPPQQIFLSTTDSFQYISIIASIKSLLSHSQINQLYFNKNKK